MVHIKYVDEFPDGSLTPARVSRPFKTIFINKKVFNDLPVAWQKFILLHEFGHIANDSSDEISADKFASDYFLGTEKYSLRNSVEVLENILNPTFNSEHYRRIEAQKKRALKWDVEHGTTPKTDNFMEETKVLSIRKSPISLNFVDGKRKIFLNPQIMRKGEKKVQLNPLKPLPHPNEVKTVEIKPVEVLKATFEVKPPLISAEEKEVLDEPIVKQNNYETMPTNATGLIPDTTAPKEEEKIGATAEKTYFGMSASGGYVWGVLTVLILFLVITFLIVRFTPPKKFSV